MRKSPRAARGRVLQRADPKLPVKAMITYRASEPVIFGDAATCAEVHCFRWRRGWSVIVPRGSQQEATVRSAAAGHIDHHKRAFKEEAIEGGLVRFDFGPGQACFRARLHRRRFTRSPLYVVRGGDWRKHLGTIRNHTRPQDWVEDMGLNLEGVRRRIERG